MLGLIRETILKQKQAAIKKRFPSVQLNLHIDMPSPSMNKMAELAGVVNAVNLWEPKLAALSDGELKALSAEFKTHIQKKSQEIVSHLEELEDALFAAAIPEEKQRIKEKIRNTRNKIYEEILPKAFATVREASKRTIGLRHFDSQIAGGIILHEGKIAEMATGEGKTLVATLPAYLNALLGKGVHVVTVNDYLARRDREWMGPVYEFLGLTVGVIQHELSDEQRQVAYGCDITYGTNNEFGFDYLRDNMKYRAQDMVQRPFYFAIVDEVDSILVDEARTPLIISGPAEESTDKYYTAKRIADQLRGRRITERDEIDAKYKGIDLSKGYDYLADEKGNTVSMSEEGEAKAAKVWGVESLHDIETIEYRHHTIAALRAKEFFQKDIEYVVKDGEVIIVDEFTGRMMPGRRWSDGLHQAVEAKEGLKIERENQTLATITFQNYFRMYEKLAGMTGTAFTEAVEFETIYQLDVVVIPTNRKLVRQNFADCVYKTEKEKFDAVINEIAELYNAGRPVLVGTISIEKSEHIAALLKMRGIPHQVLNAKYHELEAQIVAQAGRYKAVTIATNMAGRGTDILLGGNPEFMAKSLIRQRLDPADPNFKEEYLKLLSSFRQQAQEEHNKVVAVGGLHVLGTERHEARRIDNQLRGRCGRQGDPGSSRFYVSLGDELMRLFGSEKLIGMMDRLGLEEGQVIEHPWITKSIEIAQHRVEQHNFEIRKQLLEYDNVMNKQREVIYTQRRQILEGASMKEEILAVTEKIIADICALYINENLTPQEWDISGLTSNINLKFGLELDAALVQNSNTEIKELLLSKITQAYAEKEQSIGSDLLRHLERMVFLQIIDAKWKDHLYAMDSLREGIGLRAYGQRDPLVEYKREAFAMFSEMMAGIEEEAVEMIFKLKPAPPKEFRGVFSSVSQELVHPEAEKFEIPAQEEPGPEANLPPQPAVKPGFGAQQKPVQQRTVDAKVGRNDPCPCGSGKKYKKCCGK
ncbi:MAG: preprotein translocase subunit SecA [Candidatus Omnitrophica bacterium]|nr:preprotein translocase subunit SecA [Candidatus Omnitrophota bacterium]MDD5653260.1 preprotein translocase subunit SecA [Candidatus Omnitrophota bacterium]